MLEKIFSNMKPRENWNKYFTKNSGLIIDLGCGYGADSYFLAKNGYKVIAVDETNNIKFIDKNLTFINQNIDKLIDEEFDGVIANFSLHFLDSEKRFKVISHYLSHLKSEGIFYILIFEEFVTSDFLRLFPNDIEIRYFTKEDNHKPLGKHVHKIAKIVYIKKGV